MDNKNVHDPMLIYPQTLGVIKWTRPKDGHQKYPMSYITNSGNRILQTLEKILEIELLKLWRK